jgi:hypothetical protein
MMLFERYCFVRGRRELVEETMDEIPAIALACLVVYDEAAPAEVREMHARLEDCPAMRDWMRGHACAVLTRLIEANEGVLAALNERRFFGKLLLEMADSASVFKFDAMFLLAVAFQTLERSAVADFLNPGFVDLLESIGLSITLVDGRDLSNEMKRVAYRLNEMLPDDSELKMILYETVPRQLLCKFEDIAVRE